MKQWSSGATAMKQLWLRRSSAANRVPGSHFGRLCALVWPTHEAERLITIVSGHLCDQRGRYAKRRNENSSDTEADAQGAETGTGYIQCETERPQLCSKPTCNLRIICKRAVTDCGPHQSFHNGTPWLPWSHFALLCTVNFLINCYAVRSSPNGSLVASAPSHI